MVRIGKKTKKDDIVVKDIADSSIKYTDENDKFSIENISSSDLYSLYNMCISFRQRIDADLFGKEFKVIKIIENEFRRRIHEMYNKYEK